MRTVFHRDDTEGGHIVYNATLRAFAAHYSYQPKACRPYRAQTKGKVERPYRYVREDFFLGGSFRNLEDLNLQFRAWLDQVANLGPTPPRGALSPNTSPRSCRIFRRCPPDRSRRCCNSSGASPATA